MDTYNQDDKVSIDFESGIIKIAEKEFKFASLPKVLMNIFEAKGLVNYLKNQQS